MASKWRIFLEEYLKEQSISANRVLDIGGSQKPITGRLKDFEYNQYFIFDLQSPHEVKKEPDIVGDIQYINEEVVNKIGTFDCVFCLEVTEYWHNPYFALKNISKLMDIGGTLYISFHWLYPLHNPNGKDFLRYSLDGAVFLLKKAGFKIEEVNKYYVNNNNYKTFVALENYKFNQNNDNYLIGSFVVKAVKIK